MVKKHITSSALALCIGLGLSGICYAQASKNAKPSGPAPPKQYNRFMTVHEFLRAKRPAGTNVSVEGYFVCALKSGKSGARLSLVDSTDKVLSAKDAAATARAGAACSITLGGKQRPRWVMTRKGVLSLAMYTGSSQPATFVQDTPPKVRVQGLTGKTSKALGTVTKIEYQNADGDWRDFR